MPMWKWKTSGSNLGKLSPEASFSDRSRSRLPRASASASQPLGPRWPALLALVFTWEHARGDACEEAAARADDASHPRSKADHREDGAAG
eukprot:scaffold95548_cov30-Phaeocystis_antarctica.AAC.1